MTALETSLAVGIAGRMTQPSVHGGRRSTWLVAGARRVAALLLLLFAPLTACSGPSELRPLPPATETGYRLDSGDRLRLVVFGQDDLSGNYVVNDAGVISVPLLGAVEARGRTTGQLEDAVASGLAQGYLVDPRVSIEVETFRPFYILGEVRNPGQYAYAPNMTVLTAVAIAGGFTYRARTDRMSVVRRTDERTVQGSVAQSTAILPGDVIYVYERFF